MIVTFSGLGGPAVMSEDDYRRTMAMSWNTTHSTRVRHQTGDDSLRVAYSPERDCWVIARLRPTQVAKRFGVRVLTDTEMVPWIWGEWRVDPTDSTSAPLSIEDGRLVPWIHRCDFQRVGSRVVNEALDKVRDERTNGPAQELAERMKSQEAMRAAKMLGDSVGLIPHRDTGPNAKRISSAALWYRGATAKPATGSIVLANA